MIDYEREHQQYQAGRTIRGTSMSEADFSRFLVEKIRVWLPDNFMDLENHLWNGKTHDVASARVRDRRSESELIYGEGHLIFAPGCQFRLEEPLYQCFQIALLSCEGASTA